MPSGTNTWHYGLSGRAGWPVHQHACKHVNITWHPEEGRSGGWSRGGMCPVGQTEGGAGGSCVLATGLCTVRGKRTAQGAGL